MDFSHAFFFLTIEMTVWFFVLYSVNIVYYTDFYVEATWDKHHLP